MVALVEDIFAGAEQREEEVGCIVSGIVHHSGGVLSVWGVDEACFFSVHPDRLLAGPTLAVVGQRDVFGHGLTVPEQEHSGLIACGETSCADLFPVSGEEAIVGKNCLKREFRLRIGLFFVTSGKYGGCENKCQHARQYRTAARIKRGDFHYTLLLLAVGANIRKNCRMLTPDKKIRRRKKPSADKDMSAATTSLR